MLLKSWLVKDLSRYIKILADENVKLDLVKFISSKGVNIIYAPKGIKNSELFSFASKQGRILLTNDSDFLNTSLYPLKSGPGVILLRIHPPELSELKAVMLKLLKEFSPQDIRGKSLVLRQDSIEVIE